MAGSTQSYKSQQTLQRLPAPQIIGNLRFNLWDPAVMSSTLSLEGSILPMPYGLQESSLQLFSEVLSSLLCFNSRPSLS